ncbi:MAG: metal-dependent transcriptional regulator [Thermoplasmata archaeon]
MILKNYDITKKDLEVLKIVYKNELSGWLTRIKDISRELKIKPSTTEQYVKKLEKLGLILRKDSLIKITSTGKRYVEKILRNHRIIETYLYLKGLDLGCACDEARSMENCVTDDMIKLMEIEIGHPKKCPHGHDIPYMEGD